MTSGFEVLETRPLTLARRNRLADMYILSPFVWRDGDAFRILLRAVPRRDDEPRLKMAEVWHGVSADGLHFDMDEAPVLFPGPNLAELDGCEDPTVLVYEGQLRVWYTGWNQQQETGRLLLARGPDITRLAKAGVALDSRPPFANPKESSVIETQTGWRMLFEYADSGASLIGQADAATPDGPWGDVTQSALRPRPDRWDRWHLSPGPILHDGSERAVLFYNGATQDAQWRIGWAAFDRSMTQVLERCDDPLIVPTDVRDGVTDIAFASSAIEVDDTIWLYFSQSDQDLRRVRLKPNT